MRDDYLDGRYDLLAPALLPFEVANALKCSGHYDGDRLVDASSSLAEYGITLVPYREISPVAAVAADVDVTLCDASHVALADSTGSTVYTADSRPLEAIEGSDYADVVSHVRTYRSRDCGLPRPPYRQKPG